MKVFMRPIPAMLILCCFSCNKTEPVKTSAVELPIVEVPDVDPYPLDTIENCDTEGGKSRDTGFKIWCWGDIEIPVYLNETGVEISGGELTIDSECYEQQVTKTGTL